MQSPQQFIRATGFRPKRALGQNFLVHEEGAEKIAHWAGVKRGDTVLEIGPGLGAMTHALGKLGCHVIAIEKDADLVDFLNERWPDETWLRVLHADALELDLKKVAPSIRLHVVSNLPYSVSTPLIETLLNQRASIVDMTLLLQEEVVERITAAPGSADYGRLSIWVQTLCDVQRGLRIPRGSFFPVPDVESRLVRLTPREVPQVSPSDLDGFLKLVSLVFQHRRKTLKNALREVDETRWNVERALSATAISPERRPQTISIEEFSRLWRVLESQTQNFKNQ